MAARRLVAYAIDWYLISMAMNLVLMFAVFAATGSVAAALVPITVFDPALQPALLLLLVLVDALYFCALPRFGWKGQTVGKRLLGIRVVSARRGCPNAGSAAAPDVDATLGELLRRELVGIVVVEGCFSPLSNYLRNVLLLVLSEQVIQGIVGGGVVIGVLSAVLMLAGRSHRMLHDYIGGTRVVRAPRSHGERARV